MTTDMTNDILKRLQKGENAEDIANELITHLNEANKQFQEIEKEKERAAAAKTQNEKFNAMEKLVDGFYDVCKAWDFGDEILDALCDIDVDELVSMVDLIAPIYARQLKRDFSAIKDTKNNLTPAKTETEDAIESFLNKFVR
jgi:hypothetical protein